MVEHGLRDGGDVGYRPREKHAVVGMSRSVAIEHATRGVRVNAVCAGVTATSGMRRAEAVVPELVRDGRGDRRRRRLPRRVSDLLDGA